MYYSSPSLSSEALQTAPTQTPSPAFYNCQANFAAALLAWAEGKNKETDVPLLGFIWYTIGYNGWRNTDLLYSDGSPKPVYYVWRDFGPQTFLPVVFSSLPANSNQPAVSSTPYPPPLEDWSTPDPYPSPGN